MHRYVRVGGARCRSSGECDRASVHVRRRGGADGRKPHWLAIDGAHESFAGIYRTWAYRSCIIAGGNGDDGARIGLPFTFPAPLEEVWIRWYQYHADGSEGLGTAIPPGHPPARGNRQARNLFPRARVSTGSGIRERSGGTPVFARFTPVTLARKLGASAA